ncbi:YXYXY domain-containing protein [Tenacibaculum sp. 190524A05c]
MRIMLSFFIIFCVEFLSAQEPISIHLTEKEGLPDKEFYSIVEDDKGFVWLAGNKGLFRYDGYEFKLYTHPEQVGLSVFTPILDKDKIIWYTNLSGQLFCIKNDKVILFKKLKDFFNGNLPRIQAHNNLLYLSVSSRLLVLDKISGEILYTNVSSNYYYSYIIVINNVAYFFNDEGYLCKLTSDFKVEITNKKIDYNSTRLKRAHLSRIKDVLVLNTLSRSGSVNKIIINSDVENNFGYSIRNSDPGFITQEIRVIDDVYYVLSNEGVYVYELEDSNLVLKRKILEGTSTTDIIKDKNGNFWVSSNYDGIHVYPNLDFKSNFNCSQPNGIKKMIRGKYNELILVGSKGDFYMFDAQNNKNQRFIYDRKDDVKFIMYDSIRNRYFLQASRGSESFQRTNNKLSFFKKYINLNAKDYSFIGNDSVIITTGSRSAVFDLSEYEFRWNRKKALDQNRGYSCLSSKRLKQHYISSVKGVFVFNQDFSEKKEIKHNGNSLFVRDIITTNDNTLWCLSFKNGFYKVIDNKVVKHYTTDDGLLSNTNSFFRSNKNSIWIAGEKGIQEFNFKDETFRNLTKKNGIPSYDFVGLEFIKNRLYVSTPNELFSFDVNTVFNSIDKSKPEPYFTTISVDNIEREITSSYSIPTGSEKIEIRFNTTGFLSSENISYEYRLLTNSDDDGDWQEESSKTNTVIFNKLAQGSYTFQLRAKKGDKYSEIKTIDLKVKGVFYEQWWFFLLLTVLFGFLIWMYFNRKNKELQERQKLIIDKQTKELENIFLKLESLRSQMNPHFIFNALNSIQDYILNNEKKLARTYLVKFSRLIRMYLEHSQSNTISLDEELSALNFYLELEKDRFEESFTYSVQVDQSMNQELIEIPTFLIQPYVENAIKHGLLHKKENRELDITFSFDYDKSTLHCVIEDNGVGRAVSTEINNRKAFKPKSFSSEANAKRIDLLNKTREFPIKLEIKDKYNDILEPRGTIVTIDIPV